jgi:hypothetical protein
VIIEARCECHPFVGRAVGSRRIDEAIRDLEQQVEAHEAGLLKDGGAREDS